jgi:hypothetical protein
MIAPSKERTERLLEKSGRITPREVLEAYQVTGLYPGTRHYRVGDTACAIGALAHHKAPATDGYTVYVGKRTASNPSGYAAGFANAFDGWDMMSLATKMYRTGYRDGQRVRRFVEARYGRLS